MVRQKLQLRKSGIDARRLEQRTGSGCFTVSGQRMQQRHSTMCGGQTRGKIDLGQSDEET